MQRHAPLHEDIQCSLDDFFMRCNISGVTAYQRPEDYSINCIKYVGDVQSKSPQRHQIQTLKSTTDKLETPLQKSNNHPVLQRPLLQPPKDMPHCLLTVTNKRRNAVFTVDDEEAMQLSAELKEQLWAVYLTNVGL